MILLNVNDKRGKCGGREGYKKSYEIQFKANKCESEINFFSLYTSNEF